MKKILHLPASQLTGYPAMERLDAIAYARQCLNTAGARLLDVRPFSNKQVVLQVGLQATYGKRWPCSYRRATAI